MAEVHFSWSDSLQAAFSCLPCFQSSQDPQSDSETQPPRPRDGPFAHAIPPPRARPDELEGLLADASDDADALSLHTNPGHRARRKQKNKKRRRGGPKHIRVFGYDLFGRPPAIQLPESDDEGLLDRQRARGPEGIGRSVSGSSMDSDAAPLDAAAIEAMSAARQAEAVAREEEERRAKEERRRRRRERKELKRAAMARALDGQASGELDEFEGFQGSGPLSHALPSPFAPSLTSGTGSGSITSSQDFGPFAQGHPVEPFDPDAAEAAEAEVDGADFGAESYTSRPRKSKSKSAGGSGTMTTSDTRSSSSLSRGTGSNSNGYAYAPGPGPAPYNHQFTAHQPYSPSPLSPSSDIGSMPPSPLSPTGENEPNSKKKRRKSKSKASALSGSISHSTSSQSATASSLLSPPPSNTAFAPAPAIAVGDDFEGFPGGFGSSELVGGAHAEEPEDAAGAEQRKRSEYLPVTGFPSVGFRGPERRGSDMGVFLARRGDE